MAVTIHSLSASPREKPQIFIRDARGIEEASSTTLLKYRGSIADRKDMQILGMKQVLRVRSSSMRTTKYCGYTGPLLYRIQKRNFRFFTMLDFNNSLMCSWEYILPFFVFGLTNGGTALIFWGFIIVALAMLSPTAGGQYHWVSESTSPAWQKPLSYLVGWLDAMGWMVYLCGASFVTGTIVQGLIASNVDDYVWHNWHGTLLTIGIIFAAVVCNTILGNGLPVINGSLFVLHFAGFVAVVVTLWVFGTHANSQVLFEFYNEGGWPTTGLSAMVGLITPLSVLVGFKCSVHMSQELLDVSTTLPRVIVSSVVFNIVLTFVMVITVIFTAGNIDEILATANGQPFIQLFYNITQSYAATNTLTAVVIVMLFGSSLTQVAATSRQLWSFARDDGVPATAWVSKVTPGWDIPLRAVLISVIAGSLLACINLGSSTALNAMISLGLVSILTSYLVTIGCLIWRRLYGPPLPSRRWSLGKYGLVINVAAVSLTLPIWVFMFWPSVVPVTAATMNYWSSIIFCSLMIFALVYYVVRGRHVYCDPVVHVKRID